MIKKELFTELSTGFGLIQPNIAFHRFLIELQPTTMGSLFNQLWIIPIFSLIGLACMAYKFNSKKAFLLGAIIPSIYLLSTTQRFIFLGSVFFIPLVGVCFIFFSELKIKWFSQKVIYGIVIFLLILNSLATLSALSTIQSNANEDMIESFNYFKDNTKENSCLITIPDWGGMTQYYSKRASYLSSINQDLNRFDDFNNFLFTNNSFNIDINQGYIGIMPDDFKKMNALIELSEIEGLYVEQLSLAGKNAETVNENVYYSRNNKKYVAKIAEDKAFVNTFKDGKPIYIQTVFTETNNQIHISTNDQAEDEGCIYLSNYVTAYFNNKLCNTNIIKILTKRPIEGLEPWYSHNNVRIYKVI